MSCVLYLNQNHAVWFRIKRAQVGEAHHSARSDEAEQFPRCPWATNKHTRIHLLLDTQAEAITLHPLVRVASTIQHRSNENALRRQLVQRNTSSIIHTPNMQSAIDALIVQCLHVPQNIQQYLSNVECGPVTICSTTSFIETVATLVAEKRKPYLVISQLLGSLKHIYCMSGYALFTRTIASSNSDSLATNVDETYEHLRSTGLAVDQLDIFAIGVPDEELLTLAKLDWVVEVVHFESSSSYESLLKNHRERQSLLIPLMALAIHMTQAKGLTRSSSTRLVSMPLVKNNHEKKQRGQRMLNGALVSSLLVSCGITASAELDRQTRSKHMAAQKAMLMNDIANIRHDVNSVSPEGEHLSEKLLSQLALDLHRGERPDRLLMLLGDLFTSNRDLVLAELQWVVLEPKETEFGQSNSREIITPTVRAESAVTHSSPSIVLVSIIGRINASLSLRQQQQSIEAVARALEENPSVSHISLKDTPLRQAAQRSEAYVNPNSNSAAVFSVQFQLNRMLKDEA